MLYMLTWNISEENYEAAVERFQAGDEMPAGVKMVGRWHALGSGYGWTLVETDDPVAAARIGVKWSDLVSSEVTPVLTDEQVAEALAG
jgi:hypothetical protein